MMNEKKIFKRVFIVGCPRSGTTLLQGIIAAHSEVFSLPETYFFAKVFSKNPLKRHLLWTAIKVSGQLKKIIHDMGRDDLIEKAEIGLFQGDYHVPFLKVMDQIALDAGKTIWLEKTPWHLYCIDEIQKRIPDAEIIHIIRNGHDVVLSLVKATRNYPQQWASLGERKWKKWTGFSVEESVKRWNNDLKLTRSRQKLPRNTVIKFEELIAEPEASAKRLCSLLGITFEESMVDPALTYNKIVRDNEPWKLNNAKKIGEREMICEDILTQSEKELMRKTLSHYDL